MNLMKKFTNEEKELLKNVGIKIEDREYSNQELKKYELSVEKFIMSHSSKNGDINKLNNQYESIFYILTNI